MKVRFFILLVMLVCKSFSQERDLHYFIEKAQTNSPLITDYKNQIQATVLDSLLNLATYKPQVSATLNTVYAPVINGYGYDTAISNGQMVTGLVGFNQKILGRNQVTTQADSYKLIKEALSLNKKLAIKDLNKVITAQYITAWGTASQISYNQKIAALLNEEDAILKKLAQKSVYKQTDYLIFNATVKQQELVALQLKQQYQNDIALLNYLAGETDTAAITLKQPDVSLNTLANTNNIFLKQFEVDSLKLQNGNRLIDNAYKPSLLVLGDAGYSSTFVYQSHKNIGFSFGMGLSIPIYDGRQRSLQHKKNEVAMATINAYKANFKRQYRQQLHMLEQKLQQAAETATILQSQLVVAEALIEANKKLLLTGDAQVTEYILALSNLLGIRSGISQNNMSRLQIINEINYWKSNE